jgi:hypothetical protein
VRETTGTRSWPSPLSPMIDEPAEKRWVRRPRPVRRHDHTPPYTRRASDPENDRLVTGIAHPFEPVHALELQRHQGRPRRRYGTGTVCARQIEDVPLAAQQPDGFHNTGGHCVHPHGALTLATCSMFSPYRQSTPLPPSDCRAPSPPVETVSLRGSRSLSLRFRTGAPRPGRGRAAITSSMTTTRSRSTVPSSARPPRRFWCRDRCETVQLHRRCGGQRPGIAGLSVIPSGLSSCLLSA